MQERAEGCKEGIPSTMVHVWIMVSFCGGVQMCVRQVQPSVVVTPFALAQLFLKATVLHIEKLLTPNMEGQETMRNNCKDWHRATQPKERSIKCPLHKKTNYRIENNVLVRNSSYFREIWRQNLTALGFCWKRKLQALRLGNGNERHLVQNLLKTTRLPFVYNTSQIRKIKRNLQAAYVNTVAGFVEAYCTLLCNKETKQHTLARK